MVLIRNPWGVTNYNRSWFGNDTRWSEETVSQVPFGVDPRTAQFEGVFVMPIQGIIDAVCFTDMQIGHQRENEGYTDTWYDAED